MCESILCYVGRRGNICTTGNEADVISFFAFSPSSLLPWLRDVILFLSVRSTIDRFQSRDYFSIGRHIGAHQM